MIEKGCRREVLVWPRQEGGHSIFTRAEASAIAAFNIAAKRPIPSATKCCLKDGGDQPDAGLRRTTYDIRSDPGLGQSWFLRLRV